MSSVFASTETKAEAQPAKTVNDIQGHWAEGVLKEWQQKGYLSGFEDGSLKPNGKITRAELAVLINKSFDFQQTSNVTFKDVKSSNWFNQDVAKAVAAGYMKGYTDQTFKPNNAVSRQELAVIIANLLKLSPSDTADRLPDTKNSPVWSKGALGAVIDAGLMNGQDQKFRPLDSASRAEAVSVLDRASKLKDTYTVSYNKAGVYGPASGTETVKGSVKINAPGVTLQNTVIEGNLVLGEGIGEGDVFLKGVTVKGTTTVNGGGKNSVHFEDSVLVTVIVNKKDGSIRIVTEGATSVQQITLQSGARLEESNLTGSGFGNVSLSDQLPANSLITLAGTFETVDVIATSIRVDLTSGSIQALNVASSAGHADIQLAAGTSVNAMILNAIANVTGTGSIGTATINASGVTIAQTPGNVVVGGNVQATVNGRTVGNTSGTTSGGGGSSNSGGGTPSVPSAVYGFGGTITDVNDLPVANMTIKFRKGVGAISGDVAATVVTDAEGKYTVVVPPGIYTGELVKAGFITTYVVGVSLTDRYNPDQDATAIKVPAADELRIVLTWGEKPRDEDSHLLGPTPNQHSFHTWYGGKQYYYGDKLYADLDHDDVDSYGPETTTIRKTVDGTYTFYVHNYSGNFDGTQTLRNSNAKVEVYSGNSATPLKIYHIPVGYGDELYWNVFNMVVNGSDIQFQDKNELTSVAPTHELPEYSNISAAPELNNITAVNNVGPHDTLTVKGLFPGDKVKLYHDEFVFYSDPVAESSDTAIIQDLDFYPLGETIYVSVISPGLIESPWVEVRVLPEEGSDIPNTTLENELQKVNDHVVVPGLTTVGDSVYLTNSEMNEKAELEIIHFEPVTVQDTVYLELDAASNEIKLLQFNTSGEPIQYRATVKVTVGQESDTKVVTITLPTLREALNETIFAVESLENVLILSDADKHSIETAREIYNNNDAAEEALIEALKDMCSIWKFYTNRS
ncbi:S-layer homology domain-containing protein [Paenibacillus dendrobii]|uniref:S-layer homology domain-containing protein n=1 Tax=Paenibacillus dendrobii TaxID=2691084 RepID=UPI001F1D83F3|nr:S-layer homology domain-containing protein [Paenibacillus dendrobii]